MTKYFLNALLIFAISYLAYAGDISPSEASTTLSVQITIARNKASRQKGLMDKSELLPQEGLLLVFEPQTPIRLWAKRVHHDLDIAFLDTSGQVLSITRLPCHPKLNQELESHPEKEPLLDLEFAKHQIEGPLQAIYALEMSPGFFLHNHIKEGDHLIWKADENQISTIRVLRQKKS